MLNRATKWLETNWATPAFGGGLLAILTICFFGAATNTMAGWLYVISGVGVALLGVGAVLPARSIRALSVSREPILPVTAGAELEIALNISNPTSRVQTLFQVRDLNPWNRSHPPQTTVAQVLPQTEHRWVYRQPTEQRGVYQWSPVALRSGAPIGLFWSERSRQVPAIAYVYPQALDLDKCPLIDGAGSQERQTERANRQLDAATEGITRSLRPYRYGDPMRSIHWRTSARHDEFQVRELEIDRGGREVVIVLDSGADWDAADFEQAVIAACTLYFYAHQRLDVRLWTAGTGLISGERQVLETLAAVQRAEPLSAELPTIPSIYLTSQPQQLTTLLPGSRWILWTDERFSYPSGLSGIAIDRDRSLQQQLGTSDASQSAAPYTTPVPLKIQTHDLN
ncbi:DUF58 domain-containing protein [Chamaesiphon sp. OTE_8_metabat_110]|uniref:DUF58 domain-containing protein n=1 Tax=Chamaesiphon sp. OTE_8_metabat_110 TaxID=2964696 RepID=UPI00286D2F13|nr:DUF58 domain-containing protein [Chamaesiphon sp. OTE_8_metabat_110]